MITTHLHWSSDITKAPRGEMVTTPYHQMVKGQPVERSRTEHVPTKILALTNCGKVISTYWMPASKHTLNGEVLDGDRWHGFNRGQSPLLWALWPDASELAASLSTVEAIDVLAFSEVDA